MMTMMSPYALPGRIISIDIRSSRYRDPIILSRSLLAVSRTLTEHRLDKFCVFKNVFTILVEVSILHHSIDRVRY